MRPSRPDGKPSVRHVPSTVVSTPNGYAVTRGYTEIDGLRFDEDRIVVGPHGEPVLDRGGASPVNPAEARRLPGFLPRRR